jgi:arylsulfatase A-like enzyme
VSAFWDVLPTLADLTGTNVPSGTDGISFLPELLGKESQQQHEFLYWEFPSYGGQQAVRMGDWKGIRKDILKGNMAIELYNLADDPIEHHNVTGEFPEIIKSIEGIMGSEHEEASLDRFKMGAIR